MTTAAGQLCRLFSLEDIKLATRNFDDENIIGKGGFGLVYIGSFNKGEVAIKRLSLESMQGETEFLREIETLSKFQHDNLVRLHGYCNESPEKILVYEYMPNGTLVDHLYKIRVPPLGMSPLRGDDQQSRLNWEQRLKICIGAAKGLDFLHRGAEPGVIHRDIKGSNILLDGNFVAKIADFGLAKLVKRTSDPRGTFVSTTIFKGTFGYMDPEYFYTQRLTTKTDIYAFGVVLLVVLSGRPAVDNKATEDERSLSGWAKSCIEKNKVDLIIDPYLVGKISSRSLKQFVKVSYKCLCRKSEKRPTMEEVVAGLELALKNQPTSGTSSSQPSGRSSLTQMVVAKLQMAMKKKQSGKEKYVPSALVAGYLCPHFSLDEIKTATQNFSKIIGHGIFGRVYLGCFNSGEGVVAIKRFSSKSNFLGEIEILCKLQHDHIVRLKGYCNESSEMIIIYEYLSKGSLDNHFVDNQNHMTWEKRLNISLGVARGLDFLHRKFGPGLIHRNVNSITIMLDDDFVPKITGFSLAKLANYEDEGISTCAIYGAHDYLAPEYRMYGRITKKIDVYSFGVVLLLLLSGRSPFILPSGDDEKDQTHLVTWAEKCVQDNRIDNLIDPNLRGQFKSESLEKFLEVAHNCLHMQPENRHTMEDVVAGLELSLENQLSSTSTQWVESHGLPNILCLQPKIDTMQEDVEYSDEGDYSSELYDEFMEEHSGGL